MNDPRSCHHRHEHVRQKFEDKRRALEDELRRKTDTIDVLRYETVPSYQQNDLSRPTCISSAGEQSFVRNTSQRSSVNSNWNALTKDREIAKLKALVFQKDSELIALVSTNKNALMQMEERMERERKVWNEHKDLLLAGERAKFEEEKTRLYKDLQDQLKLEQERCQRLEQKLYGAQMQSSEAQLMLKENGRERINAVYNIKEQCRKEFQDDITRLRNQFQLEKDNEFVRVQERIHELENTLEQISKENADASTRQHELLMNLETSEKACVRSINDCIKKLLMATDSPSDIYTTIPHVTSFTYDRESLMERLPTRSVLKLLQDKVDDIRNYIVEQKVQIEVKRKSKTLTDRPTDYSNRTYDKTNNNSRNHCQQSTNSLSKHQKENDHYLRDVDRLCPTFDNNDQYQLQNKSHKPFQLSSEQNDTIDNLVQKLENNIAFELDRLTKQRLTVNGSNHHDDRLTSYHLKPPKKIKSESVSANNNDETNQDTLSRYLQDDHIYLRDNQQLKSNSSKRYENDNCYSFSSMRLHNNSTTL